MLHERTGYESLVLHMTYHVNVYNIRGEILRVIIKSQNMYSRYRGMVAIPGFDTSMGAPRTLFMVAVEQRNYHRLLFYQVLLSKNDGGRNR
jgi:hypothetical protein